MKIKHLDIVGFKSFVDKSSLDFGQGVTGVVGPNGCGKSNIVDAIRWVMGEQSARNLRGRMMEDIIFGGSESRKPHGLAQVSIVFDNSAKLCPPAYKDYAEIMVTRRLHRDGESSYLINKTPCRLLDITELFMDTGVGPRSYSVIEQGKVGMLVSARAEERRSMIEEAAGVTKFKARKKTSLRKMDATRQNLLRLNDLIAEVRRQIGSLKRQAKRAEQYRDLRGEVKQIELQLAGQRFADLCQELDLVSRHQAEQSAILGRLEIRQNESELQLEEKQLRLTEAEASHARAQQQLYQFGADIQRIENELALSLRQREQLLEQQEDYQLQLGQFAERKQALEEETQQLLEQQQGASSDLSQLERAVQQGDEQLRDKLANEQQLGQRSEDVRRQLMELFAQSNRSHSRRDEIERRLATEEERRSQLLASRVELEEQKQALQVRQHALATQLQQSQGELESLRERRDELELRRQAQQTLEQQQKETLASARQQLERLLSRQESLLELQRNREGLDEGVRQLLQSETGATVVADLLRVSAADEQAVEAALGRRLQALVGQSSASLATLIRQLQEQQSGATLLLPVDHERPAEAPCGRSLAELVRVVGPPNALLQQLLSGVYLVAAVSDCLELSLPAGVLLVDRQGGSLDWQGLLSFGSAAQGSAGLLRRQRQLDELDDEIAVQQESVAQAQRQQQELADELSELDEMVAATANQIHAGELQALELSKDRQGSDSELERLDARNGLLHHDLEQLEENHQNLKQEAVQLTQLLTETEQQRQLFETESSVLQQQLEGLRSELAREREELTAQRVSLASLQQLQHALRETLARVELQLQELDERRAHMVRRCDEAQQSGVDLLTEEEQARIRLEVLLSRREEMQLASRDTAETFEQQRSELDSLRESSRQLRSEADELRKAVAKLQQRQHELEVDSSHLQETILDRYRIDLFDYQGEAVEAEQQPLLQQRLKRLQEQSAAFGEVNLMAIEEYREQEQRYEFLCGQRDDLNQSLDDLQKAINQINRTTRKRFKETFDEVNLKFQQVFPRLFRGGRAELRLTDDQDLLETGIDIIVQPPGKRLQNVNLLSGGEKALTAVALIFSLFLIKPTPFCILDEVDAPLDDANIDRFAGLVREMSAQSQFIVITHSKRTMKVLDTMYGVTMQEPGVSRLVSVRLNDVDEIGDSHEGQPLG